MFSMLVLDVWISFLGSYGSLFLPIHSLLSIVGFGCRFICLFVSFPSLPLFSPGRGICC